MSDPVLPDTAMPDRGRTAFADAEQEGALWLAPTGSDDWAGDLASRFLARERVPQLGARVFAFIVEARDGEATIDELAARWGLTAREVSVLCAHHDVAPLVARNGPRWRMRHWGRKRRRAAVPPAPLRAPPADSFIERSLPAGDRDADPA